MRIYLIDDDSELRHALKAVLERAGHEVRCAENGLDVRKTLLNWPAELVICDMLMPDAEGFEVLRSVVAASPQTRFVMISGAGGELAELLDRAPLLGANAVLQKPFQPQELLDLIDALFADRPDLRMGAGNDRAGRKAADDTAAGRVR